MTNVKRCDITIVRKAFHTKSGVDFIYSRWNDPVTEGLHTFYVENRDGTFYSMNNKEDYSGNDEYYGRMSDFGDSSEFICGYIIKTVRT